MPPIVTLLSDFGLRDEFVGVMEGVIAAIAPDARVIHLTHGIAPQAVLQGALVLEQALPYLPTGVHVAVVDPGVGSNREAIAVRTRDGRFLVGPDNGLLLLAADAVGGVEAAHGIANQALMRHPVSSTFHGRDVFAPVAAHLARGVPLAECGPPLDRDALVRVEVPTPTISDGTIGAAALAVDRFGNVSLNVRPPDLERAGFLPGTELEVVTGGGRVLARRERTFGGLRRGEVVLFDDSSGRAALAVASGAFVDVCPVGPGDAVLLHAR